MLTTILFYRNGMGKTRAKKAQLRRARQGELLVAAVPLPGAGPRTTAERTGREGGEPWPTGAQVDPRTYAMAAGGRGPCCSCQGQATEAIPGTTSPGSHGSGPQPSGGTEPSGPRPANTGPQAAPRSAPTRRERRQAVAQQGSRRTGNGGVQQGSYQAGAQQGNCRAPATPGGRAAKASGGTQQGPRRAAADPGGGTDNTGGTRQGPRRAAVTHGGCADQTAGGADEDPHGGADAPRGKGSRKPTKKRREPGTIRPSGPPLPEGRPERVGDERGAKSRKKDQAHGHPGGSTTIAPHSPAGSSGEDDNDSAIVIVDQEGDGAEENLHTPSAPSPTIRSAAAPTDAGPVFLPPHGGQTGWQIPKALSGATFQLLRELGRYEDFRLRPRGQKQQNLWRYLHKGLRQGRRTSIRLPEDHGAVARLREWEREFREWKKNDRMADHTMGRCRCVVCKAEITAFCDLVAPIARRQPAIEYGPDGGFFFNEPFSFWVPPDYCSSPRQITVSWSRTGSPVWREAPAEEPLLMPIRQAREDDGLSDVIVFPDEEGDLRDSEEPTGRDPHREDGVGRAAMGPEAVDPVLGGGGAGLPVVVRNAADTGTQPTTNPPAEVPPSNSGDTNLGTAVAPTRPEEREEPGLAASGGRGGINAGAGEAPMGPRPSSRSDTGPVRAARVPESEPRETGETRLEVHLLRQGDGEAPGVTPDGGRRGTPGRRGRRNNAHPGELTRPGGRRRGGWILDAVTAIMNIVTMVVLLLILFRLPLTLGSTPMDPAGLPSLTQPGKMPSPWDTHLVPPTIEEIRARQQEERRRIPRAPLETEALIFSAYDCSTPVEVTTLTSEPPPACDPELEEPTPAPKKYSLLQRVATTRFPVKRCSIVKSRMWHHCGMHSHSALAPMEWRFEAHAPIKKYQCQFMWDHKSVRMSTKGGQYHAHDIQLNKTNYLRTPLAGNVDSALNCEGAEVEWKLMQNYKPWKKTGKGMVGFEHAKLSVHQLWATVDVAGQVTVEDDTPVRLPCLIDEEGCALEGDRATYVWDLPTEQESCPFFLARDVEGVELPDENGEPVFVSTDGSMLRLNRRAPQSHCGGVVYSTQYEQLFLAPREPDSVQVPAFRRPIHPSVMSPTTYVNQQDEFIFHKLVEEMNERFRLAQQARCKESALRATAEYARRAAEQHAISDGETVHLGRGQFVTAAGEVWYHYQCWPVTARAREVAGCYSSLPVRLTKQDFSRYLKLRNLPEPPEEGEGPAERKGDAEAPTGVFTTTKNEFFLEPRTHRLTTVAVPSKCVTPFVPLYRNQHGQWIAYDRDTFGRAPEPGTIEKTDWRRLSGPPPTPKLNFNIGGVYSFNQTMEMDSYRQVNTAEKAVITTLGYQLDRQPVPDEPINPSAFLPNFPALDDPFFGAIVNKVLSWLKTYGEICSVVVATILLFRLVAWIVGIILRLSTISLSANPLMHRLVGLLPCAPRLPGGPCPLVPEPGLLPGAGATRVSAGGTRRGPGGPLSGRRGGDYAHPEAAAPRRTG